MNSADAYRLQALLELAAAYPNSRTTAEIARRRAIPAPFLARLLAELARHGVVATSRGPRGGGRLHRPPMELALSELLPRPGERSDGGPAVRSLTAALAEAQASVLRRTTLADLLRLERETAAPVGYEI
jgi:Rrf2 family protein